MISLLCQKSKRYLTLVSKYYQYVFLLLKSLIIHEDKAKEIASLKEVEFALNVSRIIHANFVPRVSHLPAPWSEREGGGKMRDPGNEVVIHAWFVSNTRKSVSYDFQIH